MSPINTHLNVYVVTQLDVVSNYDDANMPVKERNPRQVQRLKQSLYSVM